MNVDEEIVRAIWKALKDDTVTTTEAADRLEEVFNENCPDELANTFTKLRKRGLIKGKVSPERGGWTWWADEECRSSVITGGA